MLNKPSEAFEDLREFFRTNPVAFFKFKITFAIGIFWILYRWTILSHEAQGNTEDFNVLLKSRCIKDYVTEFLERQTIALSQNLTKRDYLLIFSSNSLDILLIFTIAHFAFYSRSWQLFISISCFYLFRALAVQNISTLPYYDIYIFDFPGFFSWTVPLERASDFFYSGHVGICLLSGAYLKKSGLITAFCLSVLVLCLEAYTLVILRAHYSIDIIFGLMISHYVLITSEGLVHFVDRAWNAYFEIEDSSIRETNFKESINESIDAVSSSNSNLTPFNIGSKIKVRVSQKKKSVKEKLLENIEMNLY